jgi:thiol:disulfide interchange protein DsbA
MNQQRRILSAAVALAPLLPRLAHAQGPVTGTDFREVKPPVPTDSGTKVEVLEFFQYSCPHCFSFTPTIHEWAKKVPADVAFKRISINWDNSTVNHTKTYYALEQLNRLDDLHYKFFTAIHTNRRRLLDPNEIAEFMVANGVDKQKWLDGFNSFSVNTRVAKAGQVWRAYKIDGTPAIGIDGKFVTAPSMARGANESLAVTDFLINRSRRERGGK